jgi:membrane protein implicated in regulation of membrane protease activity
MLTVAGRIILAVLFWLASAAFAIALVVGGLALAVAFLGPWATVGIVAILIGVALIYAYVPLKDKATRAPRARRRASVREAKSRTS